MNTLFSLKAPLSRRAFFVLGLVLFLVKFNVDRILSWAAFDRYWNILNYTGSTSLLWSAWSEPTERTYFFSLLIVSLPFLLAGVWLTLKRLRSADLSPAWLVLFFVPIIKLLFFAVLCVLPSKEEREQKRLLPENIRGWLGLMIPQSTAGSAAVGVAVSIVYTLLCVWVATTWL